MKRSIFFHLTTFLCGASIMGVEISSSRFLAPYFGSSMITWTIIIGVILVAISLGNFWGGVLADRGDPEKKLYQLIFWASIWIALIPLGGKYLIALIATATLVVFPGNLILIGSLLSCLILFGFPCLVLGATSPCLIKAGTKTLENNGRIAGQIYGLSTLGSICGTFLPTFITIPIIGTNKTFFLFAGILCALSVFYSLFHGSPWKKRSLVVIILIGAISWPFSLPYAFWEKPIVETESIYNFLMVKKDEVATVLSTHVFAGVQSAYFQDPGLTGLYYDLALLSHLFLKPDQSKAKVPILVLGFGTGTFARLSRHFFPETSVDGVEIDRKIIDLGKEHFALEDRDAQVFVDDGRVFLLKTKKNYKIVFLDAFQDVTYPFHMATREFFLLVAQHLDNDGVLAINVNMRSKLKPDLNSYLLGTVKSVFPKVLVGSHPDYHNKVIFASKNPHILQTFAERVDAFDEDHPLSKLSKAVKAQLEEAGESSLIFTDDLAPVEIIGFHMLNQQIKDGFREILIRFILSLKDCGCSDRHPL